MDPPIALTIAGSDSGGGAGLQADLKTFAALGVFGTSAVTAVTAQNTTSVVGSVPMDPEFVRLQVETVLSDLPVRAVKTGMLAKSGIVLAVSELAEAGRLPNLVVDPVLVSTTGRRLLDEDAIPVYMERLLPFAEVVTPNLREARLLASMPITDTDGMVEAARRIAEAGPRTVVIKGGHLGGEDSPDVILSDGEVKILARHSDPHRQRSRHGLHPVRRHICFPRTRRDGAGRDRTCQGIRGAGDFGCVLLEARGRARTP